MYLIIGPYGTVMILSQCPMFMEEHEYAGNYKLMHHLARKRERVILRPNGKLSLPSNYTLGMARYDWRLR